MQSHPELKEFLLHRKTMNTNIQINDIKDKLWSRQTLNEYTHKNYDRKTDR